MNKSDYFETEIAKIVDYNLQDFCRFVLNEEVPKYFWTIGASSSGKYHPQLSQGLGGLVRHTKAVVWFAEELLRGTYTYLEDVHKDYVILACILHDIAKYGRGDEMDKSEYSSHPEVASQIVADAWRAYFREEPPFVLLNAIASHMGRWGKTKALTQIDRCVHLADYVASRNFIDIPQIMVEYCIAYDKEVSDDLDNDLNSIDNEGEGE